MLLETVASPPCLPRAGTVHLSARHPGPRGGPSWTAPAGREARTGRWLALPRPRSRLARDGAALVPSRSQDGAGRGGSQARVALPATCGELVQGTLDGIPCLVSCLIGRYSMAEVRLRPGPGWDVPPDAPKAAAALRRGLNYLGRPELEGQLQLTTDLPHGRGYGSSTADIGATLFALGQAMGHPLASDEVAQLAVGVEPSDSTLFPGLTLFDHRGGSFHESLGPAPSLSTVVLDPGGEVDTLAFNRADHRGTLRRLAPEHRRAFALLREGLDQRDWQALGEATTLSACVHQAILPDPLLEPALVLAREVGALGVCRAHSGTLLGLLLDPVHADVPATVDFVARHLPKGVTAAPYPMVEGGPRYMMSEGTLDHNAGTRVKPAMAKC